MMVSDQDNMAHAALFQLQPEKRQTQTRGCTIGARRTVYICSKDLAVGAFDTGFCRSELWRRPRSLVLTMDQA